MPSPLAVVVLGSGGPFSNRSRASSGCAILIDGRPRILVDAGGGTFERLGRSEIDPNALDVVLVSHLHIDHTADLAAVVFDMTMRERKRPIALRGPAGRGQQPGISRFADLLFGEHGAWSYLHSFDGFSVAVREMPSDVNDVAVHAVDLAGTGLESSGVSIRSAAVPHGMMPAVAYRVDYGGSSITLSGDVAHDAPGLVALSRDTGLLVCDMALPERDVPHGELHAKPSAVGRLASAAGVHALLLTHVMPELEDELDAATAIVRSLYHGVVTNARDGAIVAASPAA